VDLTKIKDLTPKLFVDKYKASGGTEYFLSYEDKKRKAVFAFCRLRIAEDGEYPAFIRELHTYGQLIKIGAKGNNSSQHMGLGKKLILEAEKICKKNKISELAVISGVGVRDYYRKLGYALEKTYMVKKVD
jgi:elongator complex protein 3